MLTEKAPGEHRHAAPNPYVSGQPANERGYGPDGWLRDMWDAPRIRTPRPSTTTATTSRTYTGYDKGDSL